jgi:hypothetical protein
LAYFLFIDESGQDRRESPYEVLAGVSIEDRDLWNLVQTIQDAEVSHFGGRYSGGSRELKAKKLLKRKVFRQASQMAPIAAEERRVLAGRCLREGPSAGRKEITALAQAKLAYVRELIEICGRFRCKAFASIVERTGQRPTDSTYLRKDYSFLFERFFYFLEDVDSQASGVIVFDELERSRSHILVEQMDRYFKRTGKGKIRASQIIPEPFFVHSDLTTGIQLADLIAYVTSWGFRIKGMTEPKREELGELAELISDMRYRAVREIGENTSFSIWSFALIDDLRARDV